MPASKSRHIAETDLALFVSGDVSLWRYVKITAHTAGCEACRARIEAYRQSRKRLKDAAAEMPAGADWDRLAAEMTANIRVGLAAGECVAPRRKKAVSFGWKPVAAAAGVIVLMSAAWMLNLPASDGDSLAHAMRSLFQGSGRGQVRPNPGAGTAVAQERGSVVQASSDGVELRENGVAVSIPEAASRPVAITVSAPGSASARYVDPDTGQIVINSVYVQ